MAKQLEFEKVKGWGGKRKGAGRPNRTGLSGHLKRSKVNFKSPLHITLKLKKDMPRLRTRKFLQEFKQASKASKRFKMRLIHYSILTDHVHLIVEAPDNRALESGMKSVCGRLGKVIRKLIGGTGAVWLGRYHLHVLKTPTEVRNALRYVLLNFSKHGKLIEHLDDFSSAYGFKQWSQLIGRSRISGLMAEQLGFAQTPDSGNARNLRTEIYDECSEPSSWLLRIGWQRAGPVVREGFA